MNDNIVNLNRYRKAKARAAEDKQAALNRVKFGRTKVEKSIDKAEAKRKATLLDGVRLDPPGDKPE